MTWCISLTAILTSCLCPSSSSKLLILQMSSTYLSTASLVFHFASYSAIGMPASFDMVAKGISVRSDTNRAVYCSEAVSRSLSPAATLSTTDPSFLSPRTITYGSGWSAVAVRMRLAKGPRWPMLNWCALHRAMHRLA